MAKLASAFERSGLHNVDYVSTISRSMMNKAQEKGVPVLGEGALESLLSGTRLDDVLAAEPCSAPNL